MAEVNGKWSDVRIVPVHGQGRLCATFQPRCFNYNARLERYCAIRAYAIRVMFAAPIVQLEFVTLRSTERLADITKRKQTSTWTILFRGPASAIPWSPRFAINANVGRFLRCTHRQRRCARCLTEKNCEKNKRGVSETNSLSENEVGRWDYFRCDLPMGRAREGEIVTLEGNCTCE